MYTCKILYHMITGGPIMINCIKCGVQIKETDKFCFKCGTPQAIGLKCPKCGFNVKSGQNFCAKCGNSLQTKAPDDSKNESQSNRTEKPVFGKYSCGNMIWYLTEKSIVVNGAEYLYSTMTNIALLNAPEKIFNGVARFLSNGKRVDIIFWSRDSFRFINDMEYANNQIDKAHNRAKNYMFVFQSDLYTRIEVYSGYIIIYTLDAGFTSQIGNVASARGMSESIVKFNELSVTLDEAKLSVYFKFQNQVTKSIRIAKENYSNAVEIVNYITRIKASPIVEQVKVSAVNEKWQPMVGEKREFQINDEVLTISPQMDLSNSYMLRFRTLASECTDEVIAETSNKVQDLTTYLNFFPNIYDKYLDVVVSKAIDILVAEGVWNITHESLKSRHVESGSHLAYDDYIKTVENVFQTINSNMERRSLTMTLTPAISEKIAPVNPLQQGVL